MPGEIDTVDAGAPIIGQPIIEVPAEVPAAPLPPVDAAPLVQPPDEEGKSITIPTKSMARIKREERERGAKQVRGEFETKLEALAKSRGFKSWAEMEAAPPPSRAPAVPKKKESTMARPVETPDQPLQPSPGETIENPRYTKRLEAENVRLLENIKRQNRASAHAERKRKSLEQEIASREAETSLRVAAGRAGVKDVEYALHLLRKAMAGQTVEELKAFDENVYFDSQLKETHPYLYATESRPADTTPEGSVRNREAPAPSVGKKDGVDQPGQVDAKRLNQDEYKELLRKRGLTDPSVGMPG